MVLAHCTTVLIGLTLGEHLQILGERQCIAYVQKCICNIKPAISLKQSSLEPKLLYRVSIEALFRALSIGDKSGDLRGEFWPTFPASNIFPQRICRTLFVAAQRNLTALGVWPIETYSLNSVNFGPGVP